jgi:hypothetical protein
MAHRLEDMHVAFGRPDLYFTLSDHEREEHWAENDDFAQLGEERFFIRCVAEIPVIGERQVFGFGVWVEVPLAAYNRYSDIFFSSIQSSEPAFSGSLANRVPMYDPTTLGLPVSVQPRDDRIRPAVTVTSDTHPLALEQRHGITAGRLFEIHHAV